LKAVAWHGKRDVRVDDVPDPKIEEPTDAIIRVTTSGLCGSDLHLYEVLGPFIEEGMILGHESMGVVEEVGSEVGELSPGDRVVIPFQVACGTCFMCEHGLQTQCETTQVREQGMGAMLFGYTKLYGSKDGGQAEYLRVPQAQYTHIKVPEGPPDERFVYLSDVLPTAWQAVEYAAVPDGGTVAILGLGPIGDMSARIAMHRGYRVIGVDIVPERLQRVATRGAEVLDLREHEDDIGDVIRAMTEGRGPDSVIDAVGMEAHGHGAVYAYDRAKQAMRLETDRPTALREAIMACRNGGTVSVIGVYGGFIDKFPMGAIVNRSLTLKSGQTHVHRYLRPLLYRIERGEIDPSFVITHRMRLDDAARGFSIFNDKEDECLKVVLKTAA